MSHEVSFVALKAPGHYGEWVYQSFKLDSFSVIARCSVALARRGVSYSFAE